ncbi:MAG: carboxypeptidase regulatory-like domain-containing protein, partial [Terriglobia bacterium]
MMALVLAFMVIGVSAVRAQLATANISGTVNDSSGAVIPGALLTLRSADTGFVRTATTNAAGVYAMRDIQPGTYTLQVAKQGFETAQQAQFKLFVNQSTTFDFTLRLGTEVQSVNVVASAAQLETTSAELGQAINTTQVNDLPLNGRNFTELLDLTPGVSPVSTAQNGGGGGGFVGNSIGTFTFPAVNGQTNRSNFFLMDGLNDENSFVSTYNFAPIVDQIQEFRVESHNDSAEFGQSLGGIINVVTKSGTNQFHGDAWEFVRNNAFDARDTFLSSVTPFKQNMFGGTIGGPVILPGYNGKNKTFFFAAYEGFRNHTTSQNLFNTVTPAELNGDFSAVTSQIYNPFSTAPDPNKSGSFIRTPFPNNQIPQGLINPGMLAYGKALFPAPVATNVAGTNAIDTTPALTRQDEASLKFDHQFNERNSLWLRYSGYTQPDTSAGGIPDSFNAIFLHGYQTGLTYTHTFGGSAVASFQFARESGQDNIFTLYTKNVPANLWQTAGFSPNYAAGFQTGAAFNPGLSINGYLGFANGNIVQDTQFSNVYQYKG